MGDGMRHGCTGWLLRWSPPVAVGLVAGTALGLAWVRRDFPTEAPPVDVRLSQHERIRLVPIR